MTKQLFFDTDCLSAFLWVDNESILSKLFPGRIVVPKEVYDELSYPGLNNIKELKSQIDRMIESGDVTIETIAIDSKTYKLYRKLISNPDPGHKIIGHGEAACISLAKEKNGIIASNNLKDISIYIEEYGLSHLTTGDIMKMALHSGYISEAQGNIIWSEMIKRRRWLGYKTFSEYLKNNK